MSLTKIINNKNNEKVIDEVNLFLKKDSTLKIISDDFSIFAFNELKQKLNETNSCKFIIKNNINKNITPSKEFIINANFLFESKSEIKLRNELKHFLVSKECAK